MTSEDGELVEFTPDDAASGSVKSEGIASLDVQESLGFNIQFISDPNVREEQSDLSPRLSDSVPGVSDVVVVKEETESVTSTEQPNRDASVTVAEKEDEEATAKPEEDADEKKEKTVGEQPDVEEEYSKVSPLSAPIMEGAGVGTLRVEEVIPKQLEESMAVSDVDTESFQRSEFCGRGTISGDFLPAGIRGLRFPSGETSGESSDYQESYHEVKEERTELKEKMSEIDRVVYYQLYDKLDKQYQEEKLKNVFLLNRLAKYYQEKRMFHVLQEGRLQLDTVKKYEKQLDDFDYLTELSNRELTDVRKEISDLKEKLETKEREAETYFHQLQHKEYEVGKDTISEINKAHEEKIIDRYLKRQKIQLNNLKKIRFDFIKIRNRVNQTEEALDALDNLGSHLRLIDYEQLKHDNQNLRDKLEEKDFEITQVRSKCQHAMQILAHRREKASAFETDIHHLKERLEGVNGEYEDVREQLNELKQERDLYRKSTYQMKKDSGLLSMPRLLKDMTETIEENNALTEQVRKVKFVYLATSQKVRKIRRNMASNSTMDIVKARMEGREVSAADVLRAMTSKLFDD